DKVENGSSCTLRAVPDEGYVFDGWYSIGKDGAAGSRPVSTDAAWTFTPEDDVTVAARFAETPKLEVKASAVNGMVDPASAAVPQGGSASFTATPYDGCYLERATVVDVRDGSISDSVELDIADYQGGSYRVTLNDIDAPQRLAFSFARAGQPVVKAQPQGASVHEGEAATLSVAADAAEEVLAHEEVSCGAAASHELGYQWFRVSDGGEDVALEGETSASLTFDRAAAADAGSYYCRITQTYLGTVTSVETDWAEVSIAKREDLAFNACGLPVATAHSEYVGVIEPATGGTAPYMYAVAPDSALPEGLRLEVAEDGAMRITGTPESAGVFGFGIVCSDSAGQTRTARFALTVAPQKADLSFAEANFVYNGQPQGPELKGVPDGCAGSVKLSFTGTGGTRYSGSTAPTDAGTYQVVARLAANGYVGRAVAEFAIAQKPVSFEIAAVDCVYDGNAHGVQVDVQGLDERDYSVTYEGADGTVYGPTSEAPRDSGSYVATARVENPNLVGEQKASFAIAKAPQAITGPMSYSGVFGGPGIVLQNTAKTPVTFELVQDAGGDAPVSLQGRYATINAAGTARVIARAAGSRNYLAADDVELTLSVAPAQLLVAVDDAERMEGESNPAFTSSLVSRANTGGVEVRYSCDADEKSPAGDYIINAGVDDPNFAATIVPGTLTVKAKPEPDPGPGPVDPDNPEPGPDPDNPEPGPTPDPDNPEPGPDPDPDNPEPGPVDPPNPPDPGPGPDPDNPDPGPGPDPDNPEPGPGPEPGPENPDNPEPGPGPGPEPGPGPSPDPGPVNPPAPGPDPDPPNPPDPGPGPGPGPEPEPNPGPNPGPDPVDPGKPDPGPGPSPDNPNGPDNPDNPNNPNGPGKPDNPDKPGPSDPSKPGSDSDNPGPGSGNSDDSNSDNSGDPGDPDNPDGSANASVAAALGQTGDAAAKTGAAATGVAALIAAAVAALAAALATRRRRR
ncbi:MBG domain-containing protein, partial [uncultured Senegalimassilia sp.]|uniref:MBG domain-containing protein n=1 Tax=uncultured Senegalimassilia sp. TaxID=1714350 RepID=UPI002587669C